MRVTLDTQLKLVREQVSTGAGARELRAPTDNEDIVKFPFSILELKLQGEPPGWIAELLASDLLIPAPKFSKYLTGCALLHTSALQVLPSWIEHSELTALLEAQKTRGRDSPQSTQTEFASLKPAAAGVEIDRGGALIQDYAGLLRVPCGVPSLRSAWRAGCSVQHAACKLLACQA